MFFSPKGFHVLRSGFSRAVPANKFLPHTRTSRPASSHTEARLLTLAGLFLFLYAIGLSLAPALRLHTWQAELRWNHWLGFLLWLLAFLPAQFLAARRLPRHDPFLLPIAALLTGWGMLTIWRLLPGFGLRQSLWLLISIALLVAGLWLPSGLGFLRRYKYIWLFSALGITALTFIVGINPQGDGPRMWLGCCGLYLQPSEPLKLLLIAYLAAYLADNPARMTLARSPAARRPLDPLIYLLAPTLLMTGLALALLALQRDLGTATIILFLYAAIVYAASGRKTVVLIALMGLALAGLAGYSLYGVVRIRVDAWLNPWLDPSGGSYQIIQALMAVANGGLFGRGPGLGSPGLTPVVHSDLIYVAIAEEQGLLGASALLLILALLALRGLRLAILGRDAYHRYLAAGLTAFLIGQGLVIIGGALRLLPLTGITLPFVAYGGSSLLTCSLSLLLLLHISHAAQTTRPATLPAALPNRRPLTHLRLFLLAGLAAAAIFTAWWALPRSAALLARTDNPRRVVNDRWVPRGAILDRNLAPINQTHGQPGDYLRAYLVPTLDSIVGYSSAAYGQSGLEAALDAYFRGELGYPLDQIRWNRLLYGQSLPGLDARLTLDLETQRLADRLLSGHNGALVALDARSGHILALASQPTFDAGRLDDLWQDLLNDPASPLLNRAIQGRYPLGSLAPALFPLDLSSQQLFSSARFPYPQADLSGPSGEAFFSPLQVALAAAAISSGGQYPQPELVLALRPPAGEWQALPVSAPPVRWLSSQIANQIAAVHALPGQPYWQKTGVYRDLPEQALTWQAAGVLPGQNLPPVVVVVLLEESNPRLASQIGLEMLQFLTR